MFYDVMLFMALSVLVTIMGMMMSLGYYPQAYTMYKNKSADNISISTYSIFGVGTISWLLYGIYLGYLPIIFSFALGVIGSWLVLILALVYRKK